MDAHNLIRSNPLRGLSYLENLLNNMDDKGKYKLDEKTYIVTKEGKPAVKEAIDYLKKIRHAPQLRWSNELAKAAKLHAREQSKSGRVGHNSVDGRTPDQRMRKFGLSSKTAENIHYGSASPLAIVMDLIIDDGVPDRGHRHNLMDPELLLVGVGCSTHPQYEYLCVVNYANNMVLGLKSPKKFTLTIQNQSTRTLSDAVLLAPSINFRLKLLEDSLEPGWSSKVSSTVPIGGNQLLCRCALELKFSDGSRENRKIDLCSSSPQVILK